MKTARQDRDYKSPAGKLVTFFRKSRDGWKEKARASKTVIKRLQNRVRFLERSKAHLRDKVTALEQELSRLKTELHDRTADLEDEKKTPKDGPPGRS